MSFDWQNAVAGLLVLAAALYIVRRVYLLARRKSSGCGSCPACPAEASPAQASFVPVDSLLSGPSKTR